MNILFYLYTGLLIVSPVLFTTTLLLAALVVCFFIYRRWQKINRNETKIEAYHPATVDEIAVEKEEEKEDIRAVTQRLWLIQQVNQRHNI